MEWKTRLMHADVIVFSSHIVSPQDEIKYIRWGIVIFKMPFRIQFDETGSLLHNSCTIN